LAGDANLLTPAARHNPFINESILPKIGNKAAAAERRACPRGRVAPGTAYMSECPSEKRARKNKDLRKQFFSEEKNQKTFVPTPVAPYRPEPAACHHRQPIKTKVFWFFSSEKNILPSRGHEFVSGRH
jgi:hypothetical protein